MFVLIDIYFEVCISDTILLTDGTTNKYAGKQTLALSNATE